MSEEKFEWSDKQPPEWKGDPLGSPVNWAPPTTPPIGATPEIETVSKVRFGDVMSLTLRIAKAHYVRYLGFATVVSVIGAVATSIFAVAQYLAGSISDLAVQFLITGDTGIPADELTRAQLDDLLSTSFSLLVLLTFFATAVLIVQLIAGTILTARALSRMSATPDVPSLKFSWLSVIRAQFAGLACLLIFAIPFAIAAVLFFTEFGNDDAITPWAILFLITLIIFVVLALWFALSTVTLIPQSITKNQGGFKNIAETIRMSKGMRGTGFLILLITSAIAGTPGALVGAILQISTVNGSSESQLIAYCVGQFIAVAISMPFTCIATSALYAIKKSLK